MGAITEAIGANAEVIRGLHRMMEILVDIPRPDVFNGELEGKTLIVSNDMDKLFQFLALASSREVSKVKIITRDASGKDNVGTVEGARFSKNWAHACAHYVGRNDRLTHVVLTLRGTFIVFRRSGNEAMNDVLNSALYAA